MGRTESVSGVKSLAPSSVSCESSGKGLSDPICGMRKWEDGLEGSFQVDGSISVYSTHSWALCPRDTKMN